MTEREAAEALHDVDTIPVFEGSMAYIKELRDKCLDADIPALLHRPCGPGGKS